MAQTIRHAPVTGWTSWVGFASIMMMLAGVMQIIFGIGAIAGQDWYVYFSGNEAYLFNVETWGWSLVVIGSLVFLSGLLLMSSNMFGRIVGATLATLSILANIALLPVSPIWSTIAIVLGLFVLYAIIFHGEEMKQLSDEREE